MKKNIKAIVKLFFFLNQAFQFKNSYFYVPYQKNIKYILEIFYERGYIFAFYKVNFFWKIYLTSIFLNLYLCLYPSRQYFIKYKELVKRNYEISTYLLLNSKWRISTSNFCLQKKQGGLLLCKIY